MARDEKKASSTPNDQLSVTGAVSEVAKAIVQVRAVHPDADAENGGSGAAAATPQRSRAELKADIDAKRTELEEVLGELGGRLDVGHRVRTAVDEIRADPVRAVPKHPKTVVAAAVVAAGITAGIVALVRLIAR